MSFQSFITQQVALLTERLNTIANNAKKIIELPWQSTLRPNSEVHVSDGGVSYKIRIQQIFDWFYSIRQNQLLSADISVIGNDIKIASGAQWIIGNVNYATVSNTSFTILYAEDGYTRNDILVADKNNHIIRIIGPETEGNSPTPPAPIDTVLVTIINVTDSTIGNTPPIIGGDYEKVINKAKDFSVVNDELYPSTKAAKTYTDGIAALKLNKISAVTPNPQAYIKKADGTQVMFNIESILSGSANYLTDSSGIKTYIDIGLLLKENISNKAVDFNTINDLLYPSVKSVKTQLDTKIPAAEKGVANGVASLGADGKIPNSQIPALAISETFPVNSQVAMLALSQAEQGDVAVRLDLSKSFILRVSPSSVLENWQELLTPSDSVQSVNGQVGNVNLTTSDIQDSTNKRYQTDNQRLFNDATSSIQDQINQRLPIGGNAVSASKWLNAIALTIGNVYKAIDGTTNVAFTLAEIGAVKIGDDITAPNFIGRLQGIADYANALMDYIGGNQIRLGWNGSQLTLKVNTVDFGATIPTNISGRASISTNSDNSTRWGGLPAEFLAGTQSNNLSAIISRGTDGNAYYFNANAVHIFIGLNDGSTLGNNIAGNANSATNWGTAGAYTPSEQNQLITYLMSYNADNGTWKPANTDYVKQFLGLSGFNPANYYPKTGGVLDGNLILNENKFIQFRTGGGDTSLICASGHIVGGGSTSDLNAYVYGQNPFGIWTNGSKRFEMNGVGNASFYGALGVANILRSETEVSAPLISLFGGSAPYIRFLNESGGRRAYIQHDGGNLAINCDIGQVTIGSFLTVFGEIRANNVVNIKGASPYLQFLSPSDGQMGFIQHGETGLFINSNHGNIILNNNTTVNGTITAGGAITGGAIISAKGGNPYFQLESGAGAQLGYFYHDGTGIIIKSTVQNRLLLDNNTIVNGTITASGGFFNSDKKLKKILKRDGDVVYFKWRDKRDEKTHIGYIAQEVQKVNPDQVQEGKDGILSVNYVEILVKKMAELEKEVKAMKEETRVLKGGKNGL